MDCSSRKRKLSEVDKNVFSSIITHPEISVGDPFKINFKSAIKLLKNPTPYKDCENCIHPKGAEECDNSKTQEVNGNKTNIINISDSKSRTRSIDRKSRKLLVSDKNEIKNRSLLLATDELKTLEITDLSFCNLRESIVSKDVSNVNIHLDDTIPRDIQMWFACEYIEDILSYEFQKESKFKLSEDYCKKYDIDPARREILIEWLISVQIYLKAGNTTLHLAVCLLDILLDSMYIPYKLLQVSAVAAFWVAYKYIHGNLSVKTLISLCAGVPTRDMILDHEILVLESSRLLQAGGEMSIFFNYLLFKLFGSTYPPEIYYCGQYFLEIMLLHYTFVTYSACEKAITAIYASLAIFDSPFRFKLFEYTRFITKSKLQITYHNLMRFLKLMYSDDELLKNSSVFRKYKSSRYFKISTHYILLELSKSMCFSL